MLVWEEAYKIGHDEMDAEHLILFSLLNQLDTNINNDMAGACVGDVVRALGAYIDYHFSHEEALMRAWRYPGLEGHSAKHHEFMAELSRLRRDAQRGDDLKAALTLRGFVLEWLLNHILETDADYVRFISAKAEAQKG